MGADPWIYFVPYQPDIQAAMEQLQHEVFATASYRYSDQTPRNIDEARAIAAEDGTASILDMFEIAETPLERRVEGADASDFDMEMLAETVGRLHRVETRDLKELYGTAQPTRQMVEENKDFYDWLDRGVGLYIVIFADGKPAEICFAGYSFD
jgi:hypothetical protein